MFVIPAKAGTQPLSWAPAFAGATRVFAAFAVLLLLWTVPAAAQTFPQPGRVVDQADLLRPEQELDLSSKSQALEAQTGRQFVIVTVKSLEGYPIEDYAYRLGRAWKVGDEKKDDGVVLLVAPNEHKVWIATGYGAGSFLTDAVSGVIVREAILPQFKKNPPDFGAGITAGADAIIKQMSLPADQAKANIAKAQQQAKRPQGIGQFIPVIIIVVIFFAIIGSLSRRSKARRYRPRYAGGINPWIVLWGLNELSRASRGRGGWSGGDWGGGGFGGFGGGGGGGFGGFSGGGGSFGGGGAGGSW